MSEKDKGNLHAILDSCRKIRKTEDKKILGEVYRLMEQETDDIDIYKLNADQKKGINEVREQIKNGQFLTEKPANKDIDEWLKK